MIKTQSLGSVLLAVGISILTGCATQQRDSVRVELGETRVAMVEGMLTPVFNFRPTTAALDTTDGPKVTDLRQLTSNTERSGQYSRPSLSPNQDAMVYVEFIGGNSGVYRQSLGSQAKSPIAADGGINLSPTFTPDGRFLVFSSDRSGESQTIIDFSPRLFQA